MAATGRNPILDEAGLQHPHPVLRVPSGELWLRMRRTAQGVIGVMRSHAGGREPVDRRGAQRRRAVVHDISDPYSPTSPSAVAGHVIRDGQRPRAAHLARRLAVDVSEALGEGGTAVRQKPDPTGPGARRPKF